MNKPELIASIATKADLTKAQAGGALESMIDIIADSLKAGENVRIIGFGTFIVSKREARMGRSPQTGAPVEIKAKNTAGFKAGKTLKDQINA